MSNPVQSPKDSALTDSVVPEPGVHATEDAVPSVAREIGGREGPEPTRFGDWERAGRCVDF
jgi:hypothetical protein